MIRILLGQRRTLWREALATVLSQVDDLQVVAEHTGGDDLVAAARTERPAVVVLDAELPGVPVDELCARIGEAAPGAGVLLLMERHAAVRHAAGTLGPRVGMIGTDVSPERLIDGIRDLAGGRAVLDADLALAVLTAPGNPLTDREREVLELAAHGAPTSEIAQRLYLSAGTVRNYLSRALAKTGARTRIEAVRIAQDAGWI